MTLSDIVLFLILLLVIYYFWYTRSIAETAKSHVIQFCDQRNLQLISVARSSTGITTRGGKPRLHTLFEFEFSGNGTDRYAGQLEMVGTVIVKTDLPAYRVG